MRALTACIGQPPAQTLLAGDRPNQEGVEIRVRVADLEADEGNEVGRKRKPRTAAPGGVWLCEWMKRAYARACATGEGEGGGSSERR